MKRIEGRVWKFGDDINTDLITPGPYMSLPLTEMVNHLFEPVDKEFAKEVREGDVIVAGRNFGCGSSRESAPAALKAAGIRAVIAESFARIFFRNAVAIGLPPVICKGVSAHFKTGDRCSLDLEGLEVKNLSGGRSLSAEPLPPIFFEILTRGGLLELLKEAEKR
ncbi:MAG: 3-isopropylmalate dehydratase [Candidatus Bipolaricaulia bacterium]